MSMLYTDVLNGGMVFVLNAELTLKNTLHDKQP